VADRLAIKVEGAPHNASFPLQRWKQFHMYGGKGFKIPLTKHKLTKRTVKNRLYC